MKVVKFAKNGQLLFVRVQSKFLFWTVETNFVGHDTDKGLSWRNMTTNRPVGPIMATWLTREVLVCLISSPSNSGSGSNTGLE